MWKKYTLAHASCACFQYLTAQPALVCGMNFCWYDAVEPKLSLLDRSMVWARLIPVCASVVWTSAVVEMEFSVGRAFQYCSGIRPPRALPTRTWLQWFLTTVPQLCKGISSLSPEDIGLHLGCVRFSVSGYVTGYCTRAWQVVTKCCTRAWQVMWQDTVQ